MSQLSLISAAISHNTYICFHSSLNSTHEPAGKRYHKHIKISNREAAHRSPATNIITTELQNRGIYTSEQNKRTILIFPNIFQT